MSNEYLENLARMAVKNSAQQGVSLTAKIEDYEDSEDVSPLVSITLLLAQYVFWRQDFLGIGTGAVQSERCGNTGIAVYCKSHFLTPVIKVLFKSEDDQIELVVTPD